MSTEAVASKNTQGTEIPSEAVQPEAVIIPAVSAAPDALGTLVLHAEASGDGAEPTTEQLIADGELTDGAEQGKATELYTQPKPTIASVFAAGLAEALDSGIGPEEEKDQAVDKVFTTIKEMVKIFADTMQERGIAPEYAFERIKIPEEPTGLRKVFGMKQSLDGVRLTPYWPVLTGTDLGGDDMKSYDGDDYGSATAIGARPDGSLMYLVNDYRNGYVSYGDVNDYSEYIVKDDGLVRPEDVFNVDDIRTDPADPSRQTKVITALEARLHEQGVALMKREATNLGYEPVVLRYDQKLDRYVK